MQNKRASQAHTIFIRSGFCSDKYSGGTVKSKTWPWRTQPRSGKVEAGRTRPCLAAPSAAAFTLVELVIAVSIMSVLACAATGVVMYSARKVAVAAADDEMSLRARDILDEMAAELSLAINFTETGSDAVSFTVPDRDDDGRAESIRYEWVRENPNPKLWRLTRQYNGGAPKTIADDVRHFDLNYLVKTVTQP